MLFSFFGDFASAYDLLPGFEEWAEAYIQANVDYKEVLKELAK